MSKSAPRKPRRRAKRVLQQTADAPVETTQEPPAEPFAEPGAVFMERAESTRKPTNELVERQALEPERESGEQVAPR